MALSDAELVTFKADILANTDQTIIDALAQGNNNSIVTWYNEDASPDYWIYRNSVQADDVRDVIDAQDIADITDTDRGRVVDLLSIRSSRGFDGSDPRDRSAWDDLFSAAAGDNSQQAIAALWSRIANNIEFVFKLSSGSGANAANADTTSFQGDVSLQDVRNAIALP